MSRRRLLPILLSLSTVVAACATGATEDDAPGGAAGEVPADAGSDLGADDGDAADASPDADAASDATDASTDVASDASTDAASDASTDAASDAVVDAASEASDAATDASDEAATDAGHDASDASDAGHDASDAATDASDAGHDASDAGNEAASDAGADAAPPGAPEILVDDFGQPTDLALDDAYVYWSDFSGSGGLYRMPLAGGTPSTIVGSVRSYAVAVDASWVYYSDFDSGTHIRRAPKGGGSTSDATGSGVRGVVQILSAPPFLYFTSWATDLVQSYDTRQGTSQTPKTEGSVVVSPMFLALSGSDLYASGWGTSDFYVDSAPVADGTVRWMDLGSSAAANQDTGRKRPSGLVVAGGALYWAVTDEGVIMRRPLPSGPNEVFLSGLVAPFRLAADATNLYFTDYGTNASGYADGTVQRVPLAGGTPVVVASSQGFPAGIALDATHVYWVTQGSSTTYGSVMRATK